MRRVRFEGNLIWIAVRFHNVISLECKHSLDGVEATDDLRRAVYSVYVCVCLGIRWGLCAYVHCMVCIVSTHQLEIVFAINSIVLLFAVSKCGKRAKKKKPISTRIIVSNSFNSTYDLCFIHSVLDHSACNMRPCYEFHRTISIRPDVWSSYWIFVVVSMSIVHQVRRQKKSASIHLVRNVSFCHTHSQKPMDRNSERPMPWIVYT